jgi:hypothetical protein
MASKLMVSPNFKRGILELGSASGSKGISAVSSPPSVAAVTVPGALLMLLLLLEAMMKLSETLALSNAATRHNRRNKPMVDQKINGSSKRVGATWRVESWIQYQSQVSWICEKMDAVSNIS